MAKKVSQSEMRQMMQKLKGEKQDNDRKRKYKLSSKELALLEMEKKRKVEERLIQKKTVAEKAGVPENFFDSAKTKAFLNLGKAPQKSILKNSGSSSASQQNKDSKEAKNSKTPSANVKAKGNEWTSSEPVLNSSSNKSPKAKALLRTPSGGTINHLEEDLGEEIKRQSKTEPTQVPGDKGDLPEGFFDDPVQDAKARGVEYKDADEAEWEAFKKEIAVEVAASADLAAVDQIEETNDRQLEEIDEQMRAWSRVRNIEIKKDDVDSRLRDKKTVKEESASIKEEQSDEEVNEEDLEEFLDWRQKKT